MINEKYKKVIILLKSLDSENIIKEEYENVFYVISGGHLIISETFTLGNEETVETVIYDLSRIHKIRTQKLK